MRRIVDDMAYWALLAVIGLIAAFLLLPIGAVLIMSLDARGYMGSFPPTGFSLRWYEALIADDFYLRGAKMSVVLAVLSTLISTIAGVSAAVALDRNHFLGKRALEALLLSPLIVPAVVMGFSLLLVFSTLGVIDGRVRLLAGHVLITFPYIVRTTLASLAGLRPSYTEAAMSLGATERWAFWSVTFPLARTGIIAGAIFAFAFSMDDVAVSVFLTSPDVFTLPVAMASMMRTSFDLKIAAVSVILAAVTAGLVVLLDRTVGLEKVIGSGVFRS